MDSRKLLVNLGVGTLVALPMTLVNAEMAGEEGPSVKLIKQLKMFLCKKYRNLIIVPSNLNGIIQLTKKLVIESSFFFKNIIADIPEVELMNNNLDKFNYLPKLNLFLLSIARIIPDKVQPTILA